MSTPSRKHLNTALRHHRKNDAGTRQRGATTQHTNNDQSDFIFYNQLQENAMNAYIHSFLVVVCCLVCGSTLYSAEPAPFHVDSVLTQHAKLHTMFYVRIDTATSSSIATRCVEYSTIRLFLDGVQFPTITPQMKAPDVLAFPMVYDSTTARAWRLLLGTNHTRERTVRVAIGRGSAPDKNSPIRTTTLVLYSTGMLLLALGCVVLVAVILVVLGRKTGLLRDGDATTTYSLAYCQMALWFVVVFAAYLFIGILTNQWDGIISSTALVLIGISAATPAATAATQAVRGTAAVPLQTASFLTDLFSCGQKPQLHRLQYIVWTLTLAGVFCWNVWNNLAMPVFSEQLLWLIGISSGAYVTLREKE